MGEATACPDDNELAAYAQGRLGEADAAALEEHARACPICAEVIEELAQTETSASHTGAPTLLAPGDRLGRYAIVGIIGAGSMGVVYRAEDPELERALAIKVIPTPDRGEGRDRAAREGRALARLAHPNVLTVLDVGVQDNAVWIATELVDGPNLDAWLAAEPRSVEAILATFADVAAALASAHAADLVHRDVKPANIFVGTDGRVRLGDFGLAHLGAAPVTAALDDENVPLDALTQTGAVVGTPRYMAPEQLAGETVDGRADQFALCVALYHALWHRFPFAGEDLPTVRDHVLQGDLAPPPMGTAVPSRVRAAIVRGLSRSPDDRFASMAALRTELLQPRRRRWVVGGILAVGLTAVAALWGIDTQPDPCDDPTAALGEAWSDARREQVRQRYAESELPYAAAAGREAEAAFDDFADAWTTTYATACEASPDDPRRFDATLACLGRQRTQAATLGGLLAQADDTLIAKTSAAVGRLPKPADCETADALPDDPDQRAALAEIETELAELTALEQAGLYDEGLVRARALAVTAEDLDHLPTRAEVQLLLGVFAREAGAAEEAEAAYQAAVHAAESSGRDSAAARGLAGLVFVVGAQRHRYEDTDALIRQAEAMLQRAGNPPRLLAQLQEAIGAVALQRADHDRAQAAYEKALALRTEEHGPESLRLAYALNNLGAVAAGRGEHEAAAERFEQALALYELHLGSEHPDVGDVLTNLGAMYRAQHRFDDARSALKRALAVREVTVGPDDPNTGAVLGNLGNVHLFEGDYAGAVELYRQALAIYEQDPDANAKFLGDTHDALGAAFGYLGDRVQAIEHLRHALDLREDMLGPDHLHVARTQNNLARIYLDEGKAGRAVKLLTPAMVTLERTYGAEHPTLAIGLHNLGEALLLDGSLDTAKNTYARALAIHEAHPKTSAATRATALIGLGRTATAAGDVESAVSWLERAVSTLSDGSSPARQAEATFQLALALALDPNQEERARSEGERARAMHVEMGDEGKEGLAEVDAWLKTRR